MSNPMNVMYAAKRILQNYKSLDVLYLNNSIINIDHFNWDVMREAFLTFRLPYFCSTGRTSENGKNFVTVKGSGTTDLGFSRDFCLQVLSPFILVMELKDLLKEAELPGRVVWTGSTTCNRADFSFFDPQHVQSENSFYGQITKKDNGEYIGDYSQGNISIANPTRDATMMVEAATLWAQLGTDIAAKAEEVQA